MKIFKEGNLEKAKRPARFVCWRCGCEWEANNDEYILEEGQREMYPVCNCPCCNERVSGKVVIYR